MLELTILTAFSIYQSFFHQRGMKNCVIKTMDLLSSIQLHSKKGEDEDEEEEEEEERDDGAHAVQQ